MKQNIGSTDRIIRGALAVILLVVALVAGLDSAGGIIALVLAVVMAATAAIRFCPLYAPFKFTTTKR
jgi:hypothetical protein